MFLNRHSVQKGTVSQSLGPCQILTYCTNYVMTSHICTLSNQIFGNTTPKFVNSLAFWIIENISKVSL